MEIKITNKETLIPTTKQTKILILNKLAFIKGDRRNATINLRIRILFIDENKRGGSDGYGFPVFENIPQKIDLLSYFKDKSYIHKEIEYVSIQAIQDFEIIAEIDLS